MEDFPTWLAIGLIAGLGSTLFAHKKKKSKNSLQVVVFCPYCGNEIGLEKVRNYICGACSHAVAYYQTPKNINPRTDLKNFQCTQCGTVNFQNVKYCLKCGQEHGPSVKYS